MEGLLAPEMVVLAAATAAGESGREADAGEGPVGVAAGEGEHAGVVEKIESGAAGEAAGEGTEYYAFE